MIITDKSHPRRFTAGAFWLVYALIFLIGDWLPPTVVGVLVVAMALIAGFGGVTGAKPKMLSDETRRQSADAPRQQAVRARADDSGRHRDRDARREAIWCSAACR